MKVILFAPSNSIHTIRWAKAYKQRNIDVNVISFNEHYSNELESVGVKVIRLPKKPLKKFGYFLTINDVKKIISKEEYDLFHAHFASSYGLIAALVKPKKLVSSVWGTDVYDFPQKNPLFLKMFQYALNRADLVTSTSHDMKKVASKFVSRDIEVIPFGVDIERFSPNEEKSSSDHMTFGIVKTMSDLYGIRDLILAFKKVNDKFPETSLLIVGDGPQLEEYRQLVEENQLSSSVTFTGYILNDQVPEVIRKMDVFIVPSSVYESFGVAAVEAQSCAVPVIASNVGGLKEVVIDQKTGILVPPKNQDELSKAMMKLYSDSSFYQSLKSETRKHVLKHYNWDDNVESMISLYQSLL